mgnify:CR=1 FL=1
MVLILSVDFLHGLDLSTKNFTLRKTEGVVVSKDNLILKVRGNSRDLRALCGQISQISKDIGTFPAGRGMKKMAKDEN